MKRNSNVKTMKKSDRKLLEHMLVQGLSRKYKQIAAHNMSKQYQKVAKKS